MKPPVLRLSKKGRRVKDITDGWVYVEFKDAPAESGAGPEEIVTLAEQTTEPGSRSPPDTEGGGCGAPVRC